MKNRIKCFKTTYFENGYRQIEAYQLISELGTYWTSIVNYGRYNKKYVDAHKHPEIQISYQDVPAKIRGEFIYSKYYPSDENLAKFRAEKAREEANEAHRKAEEAAKRIEFEKIQSMKATSISLVNFEELKEQIINIWDKKGTPSFPKYSHRGDTKDQIGCISLLFSNPTDKEGYDYKNIKISSAKDGLIFTLKAAERDYKHLEQYVVDIENIIDTSFRFVFTVCQLGEHIPNKGIVQAIAKKRQRPSIKTLKENGFAISKAEYDALNLSEIEDVKTLFSTYRK